MAIVGVGLIGGSFALALRKAGFAGEIVGVSSPRSVDAGLRAKAINRGANLDEAAQCDLIFLSQPIAGILKTLPKLAGSDALITDAGSTKRTICEAAKSLKNFIGGHPMAGKESRGVESADASLFQGRPWLLTAEPPARLREWIESTGARITVISPEEHDRLIAMASHLPQMVSNVLARVTDSAQDVGGPGLESMTRLSRSSFEIWRDIVGTNRDEIAASLDAFLAETKQLRTAVATADDEMLGRYFRVR